jgi:hypothetical protein
VDEFRIDRREALKVWSLLLGAAVLPSILSGCEGGTAERPAAERAAPGVPRALSKEQLAMVATMAEFIIPETDTPGARAARVHEFIDTMVAAFMPEKPRQHFLEGLDRVKQRATRAFGTSFLAATPAQQRELVEALNRAAYSDAAATFADPRLEGKKVVGPKKRPAGLQEGEEVGAGGESGAVAQDAAAGPGGRWDPTDVGRESFFLAFKRLVIEGYYTSEVGATQELRLNPMGAWRADIPYADVGRAYA